MANLYLLQSQFKDITLPTTIEKFIEHARMVSQSSPDPSTKVGCVITLENTFTHGPEYAIASGYNKFPTGVLDNDRWEDRSVKYKFVQHAECYVIQKALLYLGVHDIDLKSVLTTFRAYVYGVPICNDCMKDFATFLEVTKQSNMEVYSYLGKNQEANTRWDNVEALTIANEAGIKYFQIKDNQLEQLA